MKKNIIMIISALILALSAAGCGSSSDSGSTTGASGSSSSGDVEQNYSENVDMDDVEGTEASSETDKNDYEGALGTVDVTIEDAKLISYEGDDVVIVSFDYTNNSDSPLSFSGAMKITAYQNDAELSPAVVSNVEGVELLTLTQNISNGESITVQKAFKIKDKTVPLTIEARRFNQNSSIDVLTKTFNFQ